MATKKPTPAQLAARAKFAAAAKAGTLKRGASKRKSNPASKPGAFGVSWVSPLSGKPQTSTYTTKAAAIKDAKALYNEGAKNIRAWKWSDSVGAVDFNWRMPTARKLKSNPTSAKRITKSGYWQFQFEDGDSVTFDGSEDQAIEKAVTYSRADKVGNLVWKRSPLSEKQMYWFDSTGVHPVGSWGDRPVRKPNPTKRAAKLYTVSRADANGKPVYHIAHFRKMTEAKQYAQAYADANKTSVTITSKAL